MTEEELFEAARHIGDAAKRNAYLDRACAHLGPNDPKTFATMRALGMAYRFDDNQKAIQVLDDLVARASATFGPVNGMTLYYRELLAGAYEIAEKREEALRLREELYLIAKNEPDWTIKRLERRCERWPGCTINYTTTSEPYYWGAKRSSMTEVTRILNAIDAGDVLPPEQIR